MSWTWKRVRVPKTTPIVENPAISEKENSQRDPGHEEFFGSMLNYAHIMPTKNQLSYREAIVAVTNDYMEYPPKKNKKNGKKRGREEEEDDDSDGKKIKCL